MAAHSGSASTPAGDGEPVLLVSHDADDGVWQLIGASEADSSTGRAAHLHHAVDADESLLDVLGIPAGYSVMRDGAGQPWHVRA